MKAVPCIFKQLEALYLLFGDIKPAIRLLIGTVAVDFIYIFGDASGSGFGFSQTEEYTIGFRFGVWNEELNGTSSNYREFLNLVDTLEDLGRKKGLYGS